MENNSIRLKRTQYTVIKVLRTVHRTLSPAQFAGMKWAITPFLQQRD